MENDHRVTTRLNSHLGNTQFVRFSQDAPLQLQGNNLLDKVNDFFNRYENIFITPEDNSHWVFVKEHTDPTTGSQHISLQQHYDGIPVYGAILRFHFTPDSRLSTINGWVIPHLQSHHNQLLNQAEASQLASQYMIGKYKSQPISPLGIESIELSYYKEGFIQNQPKGPVHMAYNIVVSDGHNIRERIILNAEKGIVIHAHSMVCSVLNRSLYINSLDSLVWEEGDNFPGNLEEWPARQIIATEHTYNFFLNSFGVTSFDNNDAEMVILHAPIGMGCPNASWNGVRTNFCDGVGTDDVTGHEWAHAYNQFSADLIYAWQSGALNEAYSDIWGETIDLINNFDDDDENLGLRNECSDTDRWMMGEDATAFGGAIRDMWLPSCFSDPDVVVDTFYFCNPSDNGGVHSNSGVINHAYALLVDGGNFNGVNIQGIGLTKAAHIFWRAQNFYLTPISDFTAFSDALEASTMDLMGQNLEGLSTGAPIGPSGEIITAADLTSINDIIDVLLLREEPVCDFQTILQPDAPAPCETLDAVFFDDFENGLDGWIVEALPENPDTWNAREWSIVTDLPNERDGSAIYVPNPIIGDCQTDLENGIVRLESPTIVFPDGDDIFPHLSFTHYVATEPNWDGGNLKFSIDGSDWATISSLAFIHNGYNGMLNPSDNPLGDQRAFTGVDEGGHFSSWGESQIDLSTLGATGGSEVRIRWELGEDGCNGRDGWYLDDILFYTCNESTTSSNEFLSNDYLMIFPNPVQEQCVVTFQDAITGSCNLNIIDISGRLLMEKHISLSNRNRIILNDLGFLPKGIHFIHAEINGINYFGKMVKI